MTAPTNPGDDDLRRALHDAVADVRPHGTYDDIRSRTAEETPMKRWFVPTLAVAAVMAAVLAGGVWLLGDDGEKLAPSGTPTSTISTPGDQTSDGADDDLAERAVPVYYVGETAHGKKLFREFQRQQVCGQEFCVLKAAVVTALSGRPADADYSNPWPAGVGVHEVTWDENITIGLTGPVTERPAGMDDATAELAVQQLVFSAQAGLGKGRVPVVVLVDGKPTDQLLGVHVASPLSTANPDEVLAAVQVDSPADVGTVPSHFTVTGRDATFEANVVWELTQDGKVVKKGFTTAQECCTLSPYEFDVTAPPGTYTLVVHDTDESGEDRPVNQDTKEITVE